MPPKKISKSANTESSKTGAKTRSSAKSAPLAAAPSLDKKKAPTKSKKAQKHTEESAEVSITNDEGKSVANATEGTEDSPEIEESWELTIKTMRGNFTVRVPPTAGVMDLKEKIYEKQGFPVENQRLMFNSKIFTENHPLTVYDVTNGSEIYFVFRMCGI